MENIEKEFTPEESLRLISQIITGAKRNVKYSSYYFILWGWVIIIASLTCFFVIRHLVSIRHFEHINFWASMSWVIPIFIGLIINIFYVKSNRHTELVKNKIGNIIRMLWYSNAGAIAIGCFIASRINFYPAPIIFIIVAIPTFITGYIIKFKPLMAGGVILALVSILSVYVMNEFQLLVTAGGMLAGYLIPGYMLRNNKGE
jgi:hypothetical protein